MRLISSRFFLLLFLPVCLAGCSRSANNNQLTVRSSGSTRIVGYEVPALQDWEKTATQKPNAVIQSIKFNKTVDATKIMMKFVVFPPLQNAPPDTAADLARSVQLADRISKKMGENKQALLSQTTEYRGHPAYLTRTISQKGQVMVESQILRVADGRSTFWFFQSLSGR